jgi:transcriptional antiterminator RfaH
MFVRVSVDETGLSTFQWMPYAIGLVGFDRAPAIIPNDVMQALVKSIELLEQKKEKKSVPFEPGSTLLVNSGPFAGYEAIFDTSLPGHDRIRILLMLVRGNQISVELSASHVQLMK